MNDAPLDLRDIPSVTLKKIREVTQNFKIMEVEDFRPDGESDGPEYSWASISSAVLFRDNYSCRVCGKASFERVKSEKDYNKIHFGLQVHHIIPRKENGKSNFRNLITLCEDCHHRTFSNGYSGVPIGDNSTLYDFNENVNVAIPAEKVSSPDIRIKNARLKEIARVYDDSTSQYRIFRTEDSAIDTQISVMPRVEFHRLLKDLQLQDQVHSYMTLHGTANHREFPVKVFTDKDGKIILW